MPDLLTLFALIAVVLTVSALASGLVERGPISFPILFLGLGVLLGPRAFGILSMDAHDPTLEAVAIVSLAFVLFLDAIKLRPAEFRKGWYIPMLVLGPGTLLVIGFVALASWLLMGTTPVQSLLIGAILSSTDPVVLRDVLRDPRIPRSIRQTLSVEAGTNDLVVLPIVLVLIAIAQARPWGADAWALFLGKIFILSPLIGFAVGGIGAWVMARLDAKMGIRREHQALYGVGLVLMAYAAATAAGGDGFLAAFAAGAAVVILDLELCDCFLEYGETTAEMAMLLAFVLFGVVLSQLLSTVPLLPSLALAALVIFFARPVAIFLALHRAGISGSARRFIGWFGPRGLNSLLLALLAVHGLRDHVPDAERLLAITGAVVVVSVIAHGVSATPLTSWYARRVSEQTLPEEREASARGLLGETGEAPRITAEELDRRLRSGEPPVVLDVRSRSQFEKDGEQIPGSVRVLPDAVIEWAAGRERDRDVVAYCT
jgi:NhaP-type Na+/H+ or K+/H+ antiporter